MSKIDEKVVINYKLTTTQHKSVGFIYLLVRDFRTTAKVDSVLKEPSYE